MPCGLDFVVDSVDILQTMLINKVYTSTLPFPEVSEWMYLNRILFNASSFYFSLERNLS